MPEIAHRPTWAEINLEHLAHNFRAVKDKLGDQIRYMAVVKADAYGHGSVECARRLEQEGIDWFGVALPEEGIQLRKAGIRKHILCLGSFWPGQETDILNYGLTPVIYRMDMAELFDRACKERGAVADIHLKVDTGMNRVGIRHDELSEFVSNLRRFDSLKVDGLMTHFAAADSDRDFTRLQIRRFDESLDTVKKHGYNPSFKDLANSPGALGYEDSRGNLVRLGGVLYGLWWDVLPKDIDPPELKPVMRLCSRITLLKRVPAGESIGYSRTLTLERDSLIATIPIGYQDGYMRAFSNRSGVIVNHTFAPVAGRVSMDWTLLDVTDVPGVKIGDEVTLIGNVGGLSVTAEELAKQAGTISYEVTCGISQRVQREFTERPRGASE